jgi:hypothetical protein
LPDDILYDPDKFNAVFKRLIKAPPLPYKDAIAKPKLNKDGTPRKPRTVRKMDETP